MTVEEMRAIMRRRVVPENVVVQNIVDYLMDESAQLPQLTAYTFLSRLHELGMGSADFLSLLEGCGAPESAVDKIKANPAMNLQNLILTLDNSGITSEDYSEMLYTARLIWEQTQTSGGTIVPYAEDDYDNSENSDEQREEHELPRKKTVSEIFDDTPSDNSDEGLSDDEPTFEEIMQHINGVYSAKPAESEADAPEQTPAENSREENPEPDDMTEEFPDEILAEEGQIDEQISEEILPNDALPGNLNDTSTLIISIDQEQLKKEIEKKSEESTEAPEKSAEENYEKSAEEPSLEISDKPDDTEDITYNTDGDIADDEEDVTDEDDDITDDDDDTDDEDDEDIADEDDYSDEYDDEYEEKPRASRYNKTALILSAVGALLLFALCAFISFFPKPDISVKKLAYAKTAEKIFNEIRESYSAGNIGGENAQKYFTGEKLFGEILVSQKEFGMYSDGKVVYSASPEKITPYNFEGASNAQNEILPPENTEFVEIFESGNSLTAVFSGTECGFIRIEKGEAVFTVRQDGALCDFAADGNEISFGSVYVPRYTHNFTSADVNEYLPRVGKNEKSALGAENIALGGKSGCSFAVWGKYSLEDGNVISARAALGDPVYAGAFGVCAMNYTNENGAVFGRLVRLSDELSVTTTDKITAAANGKNVTAVLQGNIVNVFDISLEAKSVLENPPAIPSGMRFDNEILLMNGSDGIFSAVNCSAPTAPVPLETRKAEGVVSGNSAALFKVDEMLEITYLELEDGTAKQLGTYSKHLSESELPTLELGGAKTTAFCSGNCAVAYKYFDGVSVVSECAVFGGTNSETAHYDDKTGYTAVFSHNNKIIAVNSKGAETIFE